MNFLHKELQLAESEGVEVTLSAPANVQLFDQENYELYRQGQACHYQAGGHTKESPVTLTPPSPGRWHLVLDLGGGAGHVSASMRLLSAQPA